LTLIEMRSDFAAFTGTSWRNQLSHIRTVPARGVG